jgi:Sulfotransferase domain
MRQQLPELRPGDVCAPPDYIGVGAQRAGSTWWDSLIAQHPDVHTRGDRVKEVHYFDHLYDGLPENGSRPQYERFFPRPPGAVAGEWTPRYLYDAWALPLLREAAPKAKILVILRDPVERYSSALTLQRQWARGFSRNFLQHSFQRGLYASQLERLWSLFPADQVLVLQFEHCLTALEPELARTFEFLGLDPSFVPEDARKPRSKSQIPKVVLSDNHREWLQQSYRADVERVFELVPSFDRSLWRNFPI